jgi:signal transduction histidine kinase
MKSNDPSVAEDHSTNRPRNGRRRSDDHRPPPEREPGFADGAFGRCQRRLFRPRMAELNEALVTDSQGHAVYWNERALTYTGIALDGMTSRFALLDSVHSTDREHLDRWRLGRGIPQRDDTEAVTGWILTATDIEVENQALLQAEGANRIKDEFLATVSHELRNPLNAIVGWVNLLQSGSLDAAGSKRALETIERNVHLQVSLIDEILDLSRIAKGKVHLTLRQINLIPLVESALDVIRPRAEAKNLQVEWQWNGPPLRVNGDSERLQQVISNLMSNAVKFTPAGGRVRVSLEPGVREVTLTVSDTGKGIATEFLPFVFDMFRQADSSTTRGHDGLGLGLAIARKLVELHRGRIRAESEGVDKGATFSVTLPLQTVQARPEQQGGSEISTAQAGTLEGSRILVVEDHSDSREALAELLRRLGAVTVTAESAQEALTAIGRQVPAY